MEQLTWKYDRKAYNAQKELDRYYLNQEEILAKRQAKRDARTPEEIEYWRNYQREASKKSYWANLEHNRKRMRDHSKTQLGRLTALDVKGRRRAKERGSHTARINWQAVWDRFAGVCPLCSQKLILGIHRFHFDHIIPIAQNGPHTTENLQVVHAHCNQSKGKYGTGVLHVPAPKKPRKKYVPSEATKLKQKQWREAHKERCREYEQKYRDEHKEEIRLRSQQWRKEHKST